ncbi:N-acetylglucosamine-6-phosphate deacetylase [Solwaraspora sp. WMMD1047]|uniref:N-acetylglucosamine-6-phosphate deacetylase n=1 Tax=Solwaraspora sp. WMMD1047 TaxID=3016102 RepID=UPI002415F3F0|nr:N-acetylglucosamine-6-phosphate deacetylase [Solwaraspora sp. WMMD1047]MDG4833722.1 N-acetylglucosamine-6-phosphate deacetylase [Solwaraspora sp. WMMD1047]
MTVRVSGKVVTPTGVIRQGCVETDGDRITAVAEYPTIRDGHWIVPGFVDLHTHGGGGHTFTTGDAESARGAAEFHLAHGTTTLLASLVSSPFELMRKATAGFAPLVEKGILGGVHYEGPYLSAARCGAQNPEHLRAPSLDELGELLELGAGTVRMVTIAPELPGALDAIRLLVSRGVIAAIGHTDATYDQTLAAIEAGATVGTHLFNGMPSPHHREPGPVFALLNSPKVVCELVADGVHLHPGTLTFATSVTGPDRAALITDAMAAAGMADGEYELGGQTVVVADRVARLAGAGGEPGAIAGSTLTMDAALRRAVEAGVSVPDASRMASGTPANVIGLGARVGALMPGWRADLVVLDDNLEVVRVMRAGAWVS